MFKTRFKIVLISNCQVEVIRKWNEHFSNKRIKHLKLPFCNAVENEKLHTARTKIVPRCASTCIIKNYIFWQNFDKFSLLPERRGDPQKKICERSYVHNRTHTLHMLMFH